MGVLHFEQKNWMLCPEFAIEASSAGLLIMRIAPQGEGADML
jgi:hypothetical protein